MHKLKKFACTIFKKHASNLLHLYKIYNHRLFLYPRNATTTSINLIPKLTQMMFVVIVTKVVEVAEVMRVVLVALVEDVSLISLSQNTSGHTDMETMDLKFLPIPL